MPVDAKCVVNPNGWRGAKREATIGLTKSFGEFNIRLMVGQPQTDLGDAHGPLVEFQTIELVHIHLGKCPDVEFSLKSAPLGETGDQGLVL